MVIDTVQEIAPGVVEIDEYIVESDIGATAGHGGGPEKGGGAGG
jgi:hypothetical protein